MKAYIYNVETNEVAVVIDADTHNMIDDEIANQNYDSDMYGVTFSPTGLTETDTTDYVILDK